MTTGAIERILLKMIKEHPVFGQFPEVGVGTLDTITEETNHERISVLCNVSSNGDWQRSYARILIFVPDIWSGFYLPNHRKLSEYEKLILKMFERLIFFEHEKETGYIEMADISTCPEPETFSHYINMRVKITNSNFKL